MRLDPSDRSASPLDIVRESYLALPHHGLDALAAFVHADVAWSHLAGFDSPARPDVTYEPTEFLIGEDHVLALGHATYDNTRTAAFAHLWLHEGGRIRQVRAFEDTAVGLGRHPGIAPTSEEEIA